MNWKMRLTLAKFFWLLSWAFSSSEASPTSDTDTPKKRPQTSPRKPIPKPVVNSVWREHKFALKDGIKTTTGPLIAVRKHAKHTGDQVVQGVPIVVILAAPILPLAAPASLPPEISASN